MRIQPVNFIENIKPGSTVVLCGKRGMGKTTYARYICSSLSARVFNFMIMVGNKDNALEWGQYVDPRMVFFKSLDKLKQITKSLERGIDEKETGKVNQKFRDRVFNANGKGESEYTVTGASNMKEVVLVLDDLGSDKVFMKSDVVKDIFCNGRHYNLTTILLLQYYKQVLPEIRGNIQYFGTLFSINEEDYRTFHKEKCSSIPYKEFKKYFIEITRDNGMMWFDNTCNHRNIDRMIYYKRIPHPYDPPPFTSKYIVNYLDERDKRHSSTSITENKRRKVEQRVDTSMKTTNYHRNNKRKVTDSNLDQVSNRSFQYLH
jgi:hypothetical protein